MKPRRGASGPGRSRAETSAGGIGATGARAGLRLALPWLIVLLGLSYLGWSRASRGVGPRDGLAAILGSKRPVGPGSEKVGAPAPHLSTRADGMRVGEFDPDALAAFLVARGLPAPTRPLGAIESELALRLQAALTELRRAPGADSFGRVGQLFDFMVNVEQAQAAYERAMRLDPRDARWPHYLGRIAARDGRLAEAEQLFRTAMRLAPEAPGTQWQLARVLRDLERTAEAEELLRRSTRLAGPIVHPWTELARIALERGDPEAALRELQDALARDPSSARALELQGRALAALGRHAELAAQPTPRGSGGLEPVPDPLMNELMTASDSVAYYRSLAQFQQAAGQWAGMVAALERVVARDPGNLDDLLLLADAYARAGRPAEALAAAERAIARRPGSARCRQTRASLAFSLEDFVGAAAFAAEALELDPRFVPALSTQAWALGALERYAEALPLAQRAVALEPLDPDLQALLGRLLLETGRRGEAEATFRRCVELGPAAELCRQQLAELRGTRPGR